MGSSSLTRSSWGGDDDPAEEEEGEESEREVEEVLNEVIGRRRIEV